MTTLILLLTFAGFYALYNTSSQAKLSQQGSLEIWLRKQSSLKAVGIILLIISIILTVINYGLTAGMLYWVVIVSTIASLIIIICPLKIMTYKTVALIFIGIVIAENIIL